jgi:DNA-binding MarR family transcriptional regulator
MNGVEVPGTGRGNGQNRRALTAGKRKLTAAVKTYEAEVATILGGVLSPEEQQQMSDYVSRLLTSIDHAEGT